MWARVAGLLLLVAGAALAPPAAAQPPTWWVAAGPQAGLETSDRLDDIVETEASAVLAAGWHLFSLGPVLLGPEAEGSVGRLQAELGTQGDTVTVFRGRLGLRAAWWGDEDDDPWLFPYVRAGVVYRKDDGRFVADDGVGWYAGVGVDVRLAEHWWIGPFVTYERVGLSIETATVLVGFTITFSF
jgi:hypothetical protein